MRQHMKIALVALSLVFVTVFAVTANGTEESGSAGPVIIGSNSAPRTLNPLYFPSRQDAIVTNLIFDNFVEPDEDGYIQGRLAESFDISDDGMTYTFHLRHGVTWHDGEIFDGDDVVATLEMLADPAYDGGMDRVDLIEGVEAFASGDSSSISGIALSDDKYTVTISITTPSATFLPGLYFPILPAHIIEGIDLTNLAEAPFNSAPVGTGPFKFVEWKVGDSITLTKNADYYLGEPKVDSIIVKFGDTVSLTSQMQAGALDILEVDLDGYATFKDDPSYNIYSYAMESVDYVGFRTAPGRATDTREDKPVYHVAIRQALAYATNKQALVQTAFGATGYVHDSIFPKGSIGDSPNDNPYNFDLDRAKALIEGEGYVMNSQTGIYELNGQPLEIELLYAESNSAVAAILKEQWAAAGVKTDLKLLDFGALINVLLRKSDAQGDLESDGAAFDESTAATDANFEAYLLGFAQESDPDEYAQYFVDDPFWNFYAYDNADVQKWFAEQAVTVDEAERSAILQNISEQINEDLPWFVYDGKNEIIVTGANLGGYSADTRGYTRDAYNWYLQ